MSDTADHVATKETYEPNCDVSSCPTPSPQSYNEKQPLPDSEAPPMYPEPNTVCQSHTVYQTFSNVNPEDPTQTTSTTASSGFEDKTIRRGFVRKVGALLTHSLPQVLCIV